ncbi:hypothetical protein KJ032_26915, partial [Salmonella enterica subsp. enterica serovar Typhimurium]|nr:hypothetical protein [Salmonella enterica subsp. enterica serovar Typhimurium]
FFFSSSPKKMALQEEPQELQNPTMEFDPLLFCEEGFEEDLGDNDSKEESENCDGFSKKQSSFPLIFLESDMFWENDELSSLISKKEQTHVYFSGEISYGSLMEARKEVVE